ncbi:MAG TPA: hypothetical protein VKA68_17810 [bacterium]|nr:hypothetical protein [bacterium]
MGKKIAVFIVCLVLFMTPLFSQVKFYPQPPILINTPTAGSLEQGSYAAEIRMMPEGGVLGNIMVGLTGRFLLGVSYGGTGIIGEDSVDWNPEPGVHAKYRLLDESMKFPALAIGFNSQGYHSYIDSLQRYEIKSSGFYVALSKNYRFLGNLGLHAGMNYSLEDGDGDRDPNLFFGLDKDIGEELAIMVEYDASLNDNRSGDMAISRRRGYLNAAVRWTFSQRFHVEFDVNNLLRNKQKAGSLPSRELKIVYMEYF